MAWWYQESPCYTLTNFLLAYAAQYKKISRLVNASACICMISLLVLGPTAEYLGKSWICVVGVMFIGMGTAVGFSSVLPSIVENLEEIGFVEEADK